MPEYVVYENSSGRIVRSGNVSLEGDVPLQTNGESGVTVLQLPDDMGQIEDDLFYIQNEQLTTRPTLAFNKTTIIANGTDVAILANLPIPCTVLIDGVAHEVTDGSLEIASTMPAVYVVEVSEAEAFPYQAFRGEVTAS